MAIDTRDHRAILLVMQAPVIQLIPVSGTCVALFTGRDMIPSGSSTQELDKNGLVTECDGYSGGEKGSRDLASITERSNIDA